MDVKYKLNNAGTLDTLNNYYKFKIKKSINSKK